MLTARILVTLLFACIALSLAAPTFPGLRCSFEDLCAWKWNTSDWVVTGHSGLPNDYTAGPLTDASNNSHGHFLFLLVKGPGPKELHVLSPKYVSTEDNCRMELMVHMANMIKGNFKVVVETVNSANTSWVLAEKRGNDNKVWEKHNFNVGRIRQAFNIIIEVAPSGRYPSHIAIDNIKLIDCFKEKKPTDDCRASMFKCSNSHCIDQTSVCDMAVDCPDGSDEEQDCDKVSIGGARCNFENGLCDWFNHQDNKMNWTIHSGPTETDSTGPSYDHTYRNETGKYAYVDMTSQQWLGAYAILQSPVFNPPPPVINNSSSRLYNSCYVTFYFHHYGHHSGSLTLTLTELKTSGSKEIWRSFGDQGNQWHRVSKQLPLITQKYSLRFEGKRSFSDKGDVAIDDFSMSPVCFGIGNLTEEELNGYNYSTAGMTNEPTLDRYAVEHFRNKTYYNFTTCGINGTKGPKPENCSRAYNHTSINVTVLTEKMYMGIQKWTVPSDGFYTIIAKGAGGGQGSGRTGQSRGAEARLLTGLSKGQQLYLLVGQAGQNGANKNMAISNLTTPKAKLKHNLIQIKEIQSIGGGGGGGGASYVFMVTKKGERIPMLVGAGGGGLAYGPFADDGIQHGRGLNKSLKNQTGDAYGDKPAGAGGGWLPGKFTHRDTTGLSLVQGSTGGKACIGYVGSGGFGGGGGGCTAGGGGGGYTGGRAWAEKSRNGEGGTSWIGSEGTMGHTVAGSNTGDGQVIIIPAVEGCNCDYLCAALDAERTSTICVCPPGWVLANDTTTCLLIEPPPNVPSLQVFIVVVAGSVVMFMILVATFVFLYNRYQQMNATKIRRKIVNGPDLQLNRLRQTSDNMMTEYNPNYEFGGGTYTIRDLKDIPREQLRLVKALGQGAFGEVYQGFYRHRAGDAVEMPVAVKTLPELSTNQAETDFLMEALIMSNFNHPNIVHFIGVCFDKHPRFIIIELLAGGDLKTFLRESRPKPERASSLTMKDLLQGSMDVAKGCKYLEDNKFIHRDIAARNCLLTTKGPGRVVKIADFGMARDIYRADYYRKGGKAMLPIKWMPPEAFLDGIFTSKTDVWSFGVLLWEVLSLGYMPYTGCANREVMQLVTSGGRLEPPNNCPSPIYAIMTQCWHPNPDERPNFGTILERLGYCMQDPEVIKAPLPVFYRPPSTEKDTTIMRPPPNEDCLHTDYLVPLGPGLIESKSTQPLLDQSNNNIKQPLPYVNVAVSQDQGPFIVSAHTHNPEIPC